MWARAFFPGSRYGYYTSNIVEVVNARLVRERELPILDLLSEIWKLVMTQRTTRFQTAQLAVEKGRQLSNCCHIQLRDGIAESKKYRVTPGGQLAGEGLQLQPTEAEVQGVNTPTYIVNIPNRGCTCTHFQENGIPCAHAIAFLIWRKERPEPFVPEWFQTRNILEAYRDNLRPIRTHDLAVTETVIPPPVKKATGRAKKKRMEAGQGGQGRGNDQDRSKILHRCTVCGKTGHNRRKCPDGRY